MNREGSKRRFIRGDNVVGNKNGKQEILLMLNVSRIEDEIQQTRE